MGPVYKISGVSMRLIEALVGKIMRTGELTIVFPGGSSRTFGQPDPSRPPVTVRFRDRKTMLHIARNPRLGIGEAYMNGGLIVDGDIYDLLDLIVYNARWEQDGAARHAIRERGKILGKLDQFNWRARSKRNVAHHYNLGNRLYELFLDRDLFYTCAFFTDPSNSIEEAQDNKKARMIAKLRLHPGQHVLELGCGWGGLAIYMAKVADVSVLGITLSEEQLAYACARAQQEGVADRVKFQLIDYRDLSEDISFDRITCSGMMEHIGPPNYETFFSKCRRLMKPDGILLLDFIGRLGKPGIADAWVAKYIFPGGYLPALSQVLKASERVKLICQDMEQWPIHYAHTCRRWLERARENRAEIVELYDERFFRMWEFYLAGSITTFENGGSTNYQLQYVRDRNAVPTDRAYMLDHEKPLRAALQEQRDRRQSS